MCARLERRISFVYTTINNFQLNLWSKTICACNYITLLSRIMTSLEVLKLYDYAAWTHKLTDSHFRSVATARPTVIKLTIILKKYSPSFVSHFYLSWFCSLLFQVMYPIHLYTQWFIMRFGLCAFYSVLEIINPMLFQIGQLTPRSFYAHSHNEHIIITWWCVQLWACAYNLHQLHASQMWMAFATARRLHITVIMFDSISRSFQ